MNPARNSAQQPETDRADPPQPIRFIAAPWRNICGALTRPLPNTMALGAVATGSMKLQLTESTAGTLSSAGSSPNATPAAANSGISSTAVAVLLAISESRGRIRLTAMAISAMRSHSGRAMSAPACPAISSDGPDTWNAVAMAMPPPNRISVSGNSVR